MLSPFRQSPPSSSKPPTSHSAKQQPVHQQLGVDAGVSRKLFGRLATGWLSLGLLCLFILVQLLGVYLFAPLVLGADIDMTFAQRLALGSADGTVTSYAMLLTLLLVAAAIYALIRWRLALLQPSYSSKNSLSKVDAKVSFLPSRHKHEDEQHSQNSRASQTVAAYLALHPFSIRVAVGMLGIWLLYLLGSEMLTYALDADPTAFVDVLYASAEPKWLLILGMVLVAPVYEELLFRGVLWSALAEQYADGRGVWLASIVTSLLFAAIHLQYDPYAMGVIFVLAMILSYARYKSGSLWLPILIHVVNNGVAMWQYVLVIR